MSIVDDIKAEAIEFVSGTDRSSITTFAIPEQELVKATTRRLTFEWQHYKNDKNFGDSPLVHELQISLTGLSAESIAEDFFWSADSIGMYGDTPVDNHIRMLRKVAVIPRLYHPYLAAGIWDEYTIAKCIDEGIDPMMAMALYGSVEK